MMIRANAVGVLAVVLALAGGSAAASRLVTGGQIANGTVTGADVHRHGLRARDLALRDFAGRRGPTGHRGPTGPAGPAGPAVIGSWNLSRDLVVSADGKTTGGSGAGTEVTHPATGVYCLGTFGTVVLASSADVGAPKIVAAVGRYPSEPPEPPCGTDIPVSVFAPDGTPANGAFSVVY
jgi:hypothetical protein